MAQALGPPAESLRTAAPTGDLFVDLLDANFNKPTLLAAAWAAEPTTALRLACNLRGVRGIGKSGREGFYTAALWMPACHPATLALNAPPVAEFGYLKDLPELLHRIVLEIGRYKKGIFP